MSPAGREVWIVFPRSERRGTDAVRAQLRRECGIRSWKVQEVPAELVRLSSGRPRLLIEGEDAVKLYKQSHRARVGVFHRGSPRVRVRPRERTPVSKFVRYKAYAAPLPTDPTAVSACLDEYDAWCGCVGCEDDNDPRCLPLHVFKSVHTELDTPAQRRRFDKEHGSGTWRLDGNGLAWRLDPAAFHGWDTLHVAGHELVRGFHWDVSVDDGVSGTIMTPTERWKLSAKSGYVNVYPDGHVRGGRRFERKLRVR